MKLTVEEAKSSFDTNLSNNLTQEVYSKFYPEFDYPKVLEESPVYQRKKFFVYDTEKIRLMSTGTVVFPLEDGSLPSDFYFGFETPKKLIENKKYVELGQLARAWYKDITNEDAENSFIAILLIVAEYAKKNNIDAWFASVHKHLLTKIQQIGIPIQILYDKPVRLNAASLAMGDYTKDVSFIYSTMADSFKALDEYQKLVENGTLKILL